MEETHRAQCGEECAASIPSFVAPLSPNLHMFNLTTLQTQSSGGFYEGFNT